MCTALQAQGMSPGNLLMLRPSSGDPLGSDLVMASPAVRTEFGRRLAGVYAPVIIASFGSGDLRIDVRAVAPDGSAAYRAALAADLAARRAAGRELLRNPRISFSAVARGDLVAGRVDSRLLLTLAAMVWIEPVQAVAFTDSGPRAAPGVPLRAVELTVPRRAGATGRAAVTPHSGGSFQAGATAGAAARARIAPRGRATRWATLRAGTGAAPGTAPGAALDAALRKVLAFVRAQRPPYRPARAVMVRGPAGAPALSVEFGAPSIPGLIHDQPLLRRDP
jgi:hypothetical protein